MEDTEEKTQDMIPRTYQIQMERKALAANTILFLPTGSGKTFVAIQVLKRLQQAVHAKYSQGGQRSFFLVNSVPLVYQQTCMLSRQLALTVRGYSSENKVDLWKLDDWLQELEEAQVLVMTAQILVDMLRHSYITLDRINLMVFDECHHAVDSHPMRAIMTLFNSVPSNRRPKILGLTATLINKNVKVNDVETTIKELEKTFNAKICTVDAMDEVSLYSTNPMEYCLTYPEEKAHKCVGEITGILGNLKLLAKDFHIPAVTNNGSNRTTEGISLQKPEKLPKVITSMVASIERIFADLGVYGGSLAILCHIVQCERYILRADQKSKNNILQVAITYLNHARAVAEACLKNLNNPAEKLVKFSSPKIRQLFETLKEYSPTVINSTHRMQVNLYKKELCCLIFVKERFTSKVLYKILDHASKHIADLEYLKCDFVVGTNVNPYSDVREDLYNKKQNMLVLEKFRANQINCLVSTEVMEEGIDIPLCNLVVRLDPIISFRSYVQAKGRGRSKTSTYSIMVSQADSSKFKALYTNFKQVEECLNKILVGCSEDRSLPSAREQAEKYAHLYPPYTYNDAIVSVESSISLLNRYCQTLPHDKFTLMQPEFYLVTNVDTLKLVNVYLPLVCPLREPIQGVPMSTKKDAKRVAALKACEALHKANELNEKLLPIDRSPELFDDNVESTFFSHWTEEEEEMDVDLKEGDKPRPKPGTTAKRRLHYRKFPKCLSGSPVNANDVYHRLHVHYFHLAPHVESQDENYLIIQDLLNSSRGFLLLTAHPLPKICPFTMYLASGQVTVTLRANQHVLTFTAQQIDEIKRFHMFVFLDVLEVMKEFTCYDPTHGDNHYWIAPTTNGSHVCWETIAAHRTMEPLAEPSVSDRRQTPTHDEYYRHMVVSPWYRNTPRYIVTKVLGSTPVDPFSDDSYPSYASYFKDKYNLSLLGSKDQPMLEVQYLSGKMNCLLPRSVTLNSNVKSKKLRMNLEQQFVNRSSEQLVPEFCVRFSFPGVLWLKATVLPSMLHRLNHILVADELRCQINEENGLGCVNIPGDMEWNVLSSDHHSVNSSQLRETEGKGDPAEDKSGEIMEEDDLVVTSVTEGASPDVENATSLTAVHNEDTYKLAFSKLAKEFPWSPDMEPIDIERHFDKMSIADIECYDKFVLHKVDNIRGSPLKIPTANSGDDVAEKIIRIRAICPPPYKPVETIQILNKTIDKIGPQLCSVLEALTTAKSNDIVSMERLETLGDSFLKFGVSLYLIHKYPHYDEGRLTALKSKIVSNRNLFYSGMCRDLPGRIKVENFSAKEGWLPPSFCLEKNVQKILIESKVSPAAVYFIALKRDEILSGRLQSTSWNNLEQAILNWEDGAEYSASMDMYINRQEVRDKVVSDCVEALIGAYLQHGGITAAFRMLSWFHILPKQDKPEAVLTDKIETAFSEGKVSKDEANFLLDHSINQIQSILKYEFKDPSLLLEALTHSSNCRNRVTGSYERLEFLGDAVLDFLVTCYIYEQGDRLSPGQLTDLRSALVNNNTFACLVVRLGLHKYMQTSNTLLDRAIDRFVALQNSRGHVVDESVLYLLEEEDCNLAQYIEVPKALGDIFESLAGAIFLDSGGHLPTVWTVFHTIMSKELTLFMEKVPKNPTRLLGEQIHAVPRFKPSRLLSDNTIMLPLSLWISGKSHLVYGFGKNKAMAKRSAAKIALRLLGVTSS